MHVYPSIILFMGLSYFVTFATPLLEIHAEQESFLPLLLKPITFSTPAQEVSISDLLEKSQNYHEHLVSVRGHITQPELHLDESELFVDFVFLLKQGTHSIVVFGRHNRTQGQSAIRMNQSVEVVGTFFKKQNRNEAIIFNVLEAMTVSPYPSSIPEKT